MDAHDLFGNDEGIEKRCGEIYLTTARNITFHCSLCERIYKNFEEYNIHLSEIHLNSEIEKKSSNDDFCINKHTANPEEMTIITTKKEPIENEILKEEELPIDSLVQDFKNESDFELDKDNIKDSLFDQESEDLEFISDVRGKRKAHSPKISSKVPTKRNKKSLSDFRILSSPVKIQKSEEILESNLKVRRKRKICLLKTASILEAKESKFSASDLESTDASDKNQDSEDSDYDPSKVKKNKYNAMIEEPRRQKHRIEKFKDCHDCSRKFKETAHGGIRMHNCKGFLCFHCGRSFVRNSHLTKHLKRHNNQRDYKCDICGKAFFDSSTLKNHKEGHTGERPYKCNISGCPAAFARDKTLRNHMKLHENKREYKCVLCDMAFNQQAGLSTHMKVTHKTV